MKRVLALAAALIALAGLGIPPAAAGKFEPNTLCLTHFDGSHWVTEGATGVVVQGTDWIDMQYFRGSNELGGSGMPFVASPLSGTVQSSELNERPNQILVTFRKGGWEGSVIAEHFGKCRSDA